MDFAVPFNCSRCGFALQSLQHVVMCSQFSGLPLLSVISDELASQDAAKPGESSATSTDEAKPESPSAEEYQALNLTTPNRRTKLVICKEAVDFRTGAKRQQAAATDEEASASGLRRTHTCEFCKKSFYQKRTLVAHRRIHTGEKPYKCPLCDAAFTQATHRNGHIKTHDPNYRPFTCDQCGRKFARKYSLTMHSYIHRGIFPFKCSFCEKKFRQAADMRKHEQRHVVQFSLICRSCNLKFPSTACLERHSKICSRSLVPSSSCSSQATTD